MAMAVQAEAEEEAPPAKKEPVEEPAEEDDVEEVDVEELVAQHQALVDSMLAEGILDDQFSQLQMLQDDSNPNFVEEVAALFFDNSQELLQNLSESLKTDPVDYKAVDGYVHQLKGSSSSIGAQQVKKLCITFRFSCDMEDQQGCLDHLTKVKDKLNIVKSKLGKMIELEKQIVAAGGVLPFLEY